MYLTAARGYGRVLRQLHPEIHRGAHRLGTPSGDAVGWHTPVPAGNRGLLKVTPRIVAKLKQLALNLSRSPQRVGNAHLADELASVHGRLWPAAAGPRLSALIRRRVARANAVPSPAEDFQRVQHFGGSDRARQADAP
jgi:hypothetical protein